MCREHVLSFCSTYHLQQLFSCCLFVMFHDISMFKTEQTGGRLWTHSIQLTFSCKIIFLRAPNLSGTCSIYLLCCPMGTGTENTGTESLRFLMEWKSAISINVVLFCFYRFISLSNRCELYKCCFITKSSPAYFEHFCSSATVTSVLVTRLLLLAFCPKQTVRAPAGPRNSGLRSIRLRTDLVSGMLRTEDVSRFPHNTRAFFHWSQYPSEFPSITKLSLSLFDG